MIETYCRPKIQPFFDKMAQKIAPYIYPNTITFLGFIAGLCAGLSIALDHFIFAGCLLAISGLCDIFDGTLARVTGNTTAVGAYIDLITDRMVEGAVILGFAIANPEYALASIVFLIAVILHFSTFLAAGALFKNTGPKSMHYDRSLVERAEAFILFFLMLMLPEYSYHSLMCFNGLVFCSGIARYIRVLREA